jgi:hypothetical protein
MMQSVAVQASTQRYRYQFEKEERVRCAKRKFLVYCTSLPVLFWS